MSDIFRLKHELWLEVTFYSFMLEEGEVKDELYEYSKTLFRHTKWIANYIKELKLTYNYDINPIDIKVKTFHELINRAVKSIQNVHENYIHNELFNRIISDETFFIDSLKAQLTKPDYPITAFDKNLTLQDKELSKNSTDSLVKFLFEESYKEYELIMVYSYIRNYTPSLKLYNIFDDLIDESHYHLKSFGNLMAKMGILTLPRMLMESLYMVYDIKGFLEDGIKEEEAAKEICKSLSAQIEDTELSNFFSFIDRQESYHIELLKSAIKELD